MPENTAPIFIVGCQRSGTTMLRLMLDSHRDIASGPETRFLSWMEPITTGEHWERLERFGQPREAWLARTRGYLESVQTEYAASKGKRRWADKSPLYAQILPFVWELFPDAQVVHVIRDPRDVAASHRTAYGYLPALKSPVKWKRYVTKARAAAAGANPEQYLELRYETLVGDREGTMRQLLDFLGEEWDPAVLDFESYPHDVPPRYWQRSQQRRQGSVAKKKIDPFLTATSRLLSRPLSRELGY